jgi:fructose/tagatose bisphosphate aldolase
LGKSGIIKVEIKSDMKSASTSCCAAILSQQQQQVSEYCTQGCSEATSAEEQINEHHSAAPKTCTVVENGRVVVKPLP